MSLLPHADQTCKLGDWCLLIKYTAILAAHTDVQLKYKMYTWCRDMRRAVSCVWVFATCWSFQTDFSILSTWSCKNCSWVGTYACWCLKANFLDWSTWCERCKGCSFVISEVLPAADKSKERNWMNSLEISFLYRREERKSWAISRAPPASCWHQKRETEELDTAFGWSPGMWSSLEVADCPAAYFVFALVDKLKFRISNQLVKPSLLINDPHKCIYWRR